MRKIPRQISDRLCAAADLFAERGSTTQDRRRRRAVTGVPKATLYLLLRKQRGHPFAFLLEDLPRTSPRP